MFDLIDEISTCFWSLCPHLESKSLGINLNITDTVNLERRTEHGRLRMCLFIIFAGHKVSCLYKSVGFLEHISPSMNGFLGEYVA